MSQTNPPQPKLEEVVDQMRDNSFVLTIQKLFMAGGIFKCGLHNFSTDSPIKWDEHCSKLDHEYDVHIPCANKCGNKIHIKPKQKLSADANRIPRGYLCKDCKNKVKDVTEIKEEGEK